MRVIIHETYEYEVEAETVQNRPSNCLRLIWRTAWTNTESCSLRTTPTFTTTKGTNSNDY